MGGDIVLYMLGLLIVLILLGVHIGVALAVCSGLGVFLMLGSFEAAISILGNTAFEAVRKDVFAVIPLFVLMGDFVSRSGAAGTSTGSATARWPAAGAPGDRHHRRQHRVRGGDRRVHRRRRAFSRIAYPEMMKVGYADLRARGGRVGLPGNADPALGAPDRLGDPDGKSVGALFIAGILPGVLLAALFAAT